MDALDLTRDELFQSATAFAGGIGMAGDGSCGAYVGGVLVLGDRLGRPRSDFKDEVGVRFRTYALARQFREAFVAEFGSVTCRQIQEHGINRVIVASCTPRTHEPLFKKSLREAGLNQHLLEMTRVSENVPHSGRFALVAFLHTLGMDSDEILQTFSTAPDFDESKSRYQVDHITGEISGTEYTPPECSTMKSYGICFNPDGLCRKIKHPLSYYRAKGRALRSRK